MKKRFKTLLSICSLCLPVFIAMPASAQFSAGIGAGANLATQPTPNFQHEFLALPYGGLFARYQLNIPVAFQLGLNYSGEGVNLKDLGSGDIYHGRLSYLNIPLFAQYHFPFGGYVELGPQLGFLLSAKESANNDASTDTKQFYKGTDVGAGLGLGYEFTNGVGIGARYIRGLTTINKIVEEDGYIKNRVLSIGLFYKIKTKKK